MSIINPIIFRIHDVIHLLNAQQINIAISEFKCTKDLNSENYLKKCTSNNRSEKIETFLIFEESKLKEKNYLIEGFFTLDFSIENNIFIKYFCKYIGDNYVSYLSSRDLFKIIEDIINNFALFNTFTITLNCPKNEKLKKLCSNNGFFIISENDSSCFIKMSKTQNESKQENRIPYTKQWKSYDDQLNQLLARGLTLENYTREKALNKLEFIGYYRLSGYAYYFKEVNGDSFSKNTSFRDLVECYKFDRKMRLLVLDAIERLEIALRANIAHEITKESPFYIYDDNNFNILKDTNNTKRRDDLFIVRKTITEYLTRNKRIEPSIKHLLEKYSKPYPLWIEIQVFDFGTLWRLFNVLNSDKAKTIAKKFGVQEVATFNSWLQSIKILRNICAHHSRLFNRQFTQVPRLVSDKNKYPWLKYWEENEIIKKDRLFYHLCIIHHMLEACQASKTWNKRVTNLINEFPKIYSSKFISILDTIGCGKNWKEFEIIDKNAPDAPTLKKQDSDLGPLGKNISTT